MKCEPGCTCKRHQSSEKQRAAVIAANKARRKNDTLPCSMEGCEKKVCAKGMCRAHYSKNRRNAVPKNLPFTVYQWEWDDPRIRSIIEAQADKSQAVRVGARQCRIGVVSSPVARAFLDENHLQGYANSLVRYGLIHRGELLALMTFGKPREQKRSNPVEWELIRFCVKKHYLVPGGASRLFKHFVSDHHPVSIVSYSDNAKSDGDMYPLLGFTLVNESAPSYVWWNGKDYKRRYQCMIHKLRHRHAGMPGIESMTEVQVMTALGYRKVPNQGNKVWHWLQPADAP